jgi:hypothetical protein
MKKFEKSDVFFNVIRANPKSSFFTYNGKIYHNNAINENIQLNSFLPTPPVQIETFDLEEDFSFESSWPGTLSDSSYTWSLATLSTPNFSEEFAYSESWPGTLVDTSYTWSLDTLSEPNFSESFEISESW